MSQIFCPFGLNTGNTRPHTSSYRTFLNKKKSTGFHPETPPAEAESSVLSVISPMQASGKGKQAAFVSYVSSGLPWAATRPPGASWLFRPRGSEAVRPRRALPAAHPRTAGQEGVLEDTWDSGLLNPTTGAQDLHGK
jgi:hypothetical protein